MSVSKSSENDKKKSADRLAAFGARVMTEDETNTYINRVAERLEKTIEKTDETDELADNYFRQVIEQANKSTKNPIEQNVETKDDQLAQFGARLMNEDEINEYINKVAQRLKEGPIEDNK
ncbi:MAG TPA: hypothetical protein EYQ00_01540 [Dehalococcoidia bacterium]|jgi:DNA-binding ferritin-like protein (Dps family)|nr:hypothetical protein [Dehalococcoidia bacterium]